MSTQHPDNVQVPFFAQSQDMSGQDEIQEAYYAFSHLGCDEQMWDCEGKEVDDFVVRKLLSGYGDFFRSRPLGRELFITFRVPNPEVEREEAKVLIETLEAIPRSYDVAKVFYGQDIPPIFEVILPMATTAQSLNRVYYYYKDFVAGKAQKPPCPGDISIAEWVGEFRPERINIIPLFEDKEHMLQADRILQEYLRDKEFRYQRVFLARSDPALNYGTVAAVLMNKVALQRLRRLSERLGVELYPILGVGSAPFRGNFTPGTVERVLREYPDVQTFTVQSAFKYDNPVSEVIEAIRKIHQSPRGRGLEVQEPRCLALIEKLSREYARQVRLLGPLVNRLAEHVPSRRTRKLHVGLFGYSRSVGGLRLPRAIGFCAACYSMGLPPELLSLNVLSPQDMEFLGSVYVNFQEDLAEAMQYFNPRVLQLLPGELSQALKGVLQDWPVNEAHREVTTRVIEALASGGGDLKPLVLEAAHIRRFLG